MNTVLIIDDDEILRRTLVRVLRSRFHTTSCASVAGALELFDRGQRFDAVLCDMVLDDGSGREFHARLRERSVEQSDRILFLSGGDSSNDESAFYRATRGRHLTKPITSKVLVAHLEMMVGHAAE